MSVIASRTKVWQTGIEQMMSLEKILSTN